MLLQTQAKTQANKDKTCPAQAGSTQQISSDTLQPM